MTTVEGSRIRSEVSLIPGWAYVLAALIFVSIPTIFWTFVWPRGETEYPPVMRMLFPLIPATVLAFLVLMIGYVNRDAGRRGMNRLLWTLIVIFVPNALSKPAMPGTLLREQSCPCFHSSLSSAMGAGKLCLDGALSSSTLGFAR